MPYEPYQLKESRWFSYWHNNFTISRGETHGKIIIPGRLEATYIRLTFSTWDIPSNWYLAGFLSQYYSNEMFEEQLLESWKIPINIPTVIKTNRFSRFYGLSFKPIERILSFNLFLEVLNI